MDRKSIAKEIWSMEELIDALNQLYEAGERFVKILDKIAEEQTQYDNVFSKNPNMRDFRFVGKELFNSDEECVSIIIDGCNNLLISSNGSRNDDNIQKLIDAGFNIYPKDYDSLYWLAGYVEKHSSDMILMYG